MDALLRALVVLSVLAWTSVPAFAQYTRMGYAHESFIWHDFESQKQTVQKACADGEDNVRLTIMWATLQQNEPAPGEPFESTISTGQRDQYKELIQKAWDCGIYDIIGLVTWAPQWTTGFPTADRMCAEGPCKSHNVPFYCATYWYDPECNKNSTREFPPRHQRQIMRYLLKEFSPKEPGKPRIRFWGVTNESLSGRMYWQGSIETLFSHVILPSSEEVKAYDPGLKFVGPDENVTRYLYSILNVGTTVKACDLYDSITFHAYPDPDMKKFHKNIEDLWWITQGLDSPCKYRNVAITEFGSSFTIEEMQAQQLAEMSNTLLALPWISRILVHTLVPGSHDEPGTTLIWSDLTPKQAYGVYRNLTSVQPRQVRNPIANPTQGVFLPHVQARYGFYTYLLISNQADHDVPVTIWYLRQNGTTVADRQIVPARSRVTIDVGMNPAVKEDVSAMVQTDKSEDQQYVNAESAVYSGMYYDQIFRNGRSSEGVPVSTTRYYAEGLNRAHLAFQEEYALTNPHPFGILVKMEFMFADRPILVRETWMDPTSSNFIRTNSFLYGSSPHGVKLSATHNGQPIGFASERTMTWGEDKRESSSTTGVKSPSNAWYFAEGAKGGSFNTYFPVLNPNNQASCMEVTFMSEGAAPYSEYRCVEAHSRMTIEIPSSLPGGGYAVIITSTNGVPVVAERVMYWSVFYDRDWEGGSAAVGSSEAAPKWMLSEGATGNFFRTYILIANPSFAAADVTVRYLLPDKACVTSTGTPCTKTYRIPPQQRLTISVNEEDGLLSTSFSAEIIAVNGTPIVVERAMYWDANGPWRGGHGSRGTIIP